MRRHNILEDALNNTLRDELKDDASLRAKYCGISESTQGHTPEQILKGLKLMAASWAKWFANTWGDTGTGDNLPMIKMRKGKEVDLSKRKQAQPSPSTPAAKRQRVSRAPKRSVSPHALSPPICISGDELSPRPVTPTSSGSRRISSSPMQPSPSPLLEKSIEHRLKAKSYKEQCRRLEAEVATLKTEETQLRAELTAAAKYEGQVQMSQQQVEFLKEQLLNAQELIKSLSTRR